MGCVAGCKNCANTAPDTFAIEEEFGRAPVGDQLQKLPLLHHNQNCTSTINIKKKPSNLGIFFSFVN
jgi:hypothetical protein